MKLFGFGKSKEERTREAEAKRLAEEANADALKMGREAGAAMMAAVDNFMTFRARPVGEGIYGVFVKRVSEVMNEPENSPIDLVRIEAKIFVEQLGKFNDEMKEECHNQTNEWLDLADTMGIRDSIELYITNKISDIFFELFQRSVDHAAEAIQGYQALGYKAILTQD